MRRMFRHLFTLCSAVSLLLCLFVGVLWAHSYWVAHSLEWLSEKRVATAGVALGVAYVYDDRIVGPTSSYRETEEQPYGLRHDSTANPISWPSGGGFGGRNLDYGIANLRFTYHDGTGTAWESITFCVTAPCWIVATLLGVLPMAWVVGRWRLRRQSLSGLCPACGYDLRASLDQCPECGTMRPCAA